MMTPVQNLYERWFQYLRYRSDATPTTAPLVVVVVVVVGWLRISIGGAKETDGACYGTVNGLDLGWGEVVHAGPVEAFVVPETDFSVVVGHVVFRILFSELVSCCFFGFFRVDGGVGDGGMFHTIESSFGHCITTTTIIIIKHRHRRTTNNRHSRLATQTLIPR